MCSNLALLEKCSPEHQLPGLYGTDGNWNRSWQRESRNCWIVAKRRGNSNRKCFVVCYSRRRLQVGLLEVQFLIESKVLKFVAVFQKLNFSSLKQPAIFFVSRLVEMLVNHPSITKDMLGDGWSKSLDPNEMAISEYSRYSRNLLIHSF